MRFARLLLIVVVGTVLAAVLAVRSEPVLAGEPTYTLAGTTNLIGTASPYKLYLSTDNYSFPTNLTIALRRVATSGNHPTQEHRWEFRGASVVCAANLSSCTA